MSKSKQHIVFGAAIAILVLLLSAYVYKQEKILNEGITTILETRPVDPRDLLRGEYVILRYEIEDVDDFLYGDSLYDYEEGEKLYVLLREDDDGVSEPFGVGYSKPTKPSVEGGVIWIEGEVRNGGVRFPSIEQYYVPEGAGLPIERIGSDLHVEVVIKNGEARVVRLLDRDLKEIDPMNYID